MAVYLLHFDRPYKHAKHYVGVTTNLERRLEQHRTGDRYQQNRLMAAVHREGIGFRLARVWDGFRSRELSIHNQGGKSKLCPICRASQRREANGRATA